MEPAAFDVRPAREAGHRRHDQEHRHADAVVEQRLAGNLRLQLPRRLQLLQEAEDRDGISGGDERAERQADRERRLQLQQPEHEIRDGPDDDRRDDHANCRERDDRPPGIQQGFELDVERPGKEQKAQHPAEEDPFEVDGSQEARDARFEVLVGRHVVDQHHEARADERHDERACRGGQAHETVVDVPGDRGDGDNHGCDVEAVHGSGCRVGRNASGCSSVPPHGHAAASGAIHQGLDAPADVCRPPPSRDAHLVGVGRDADRDGEGDLPDVAERRINRAVLEIVGADELRQRARRGEEQRVWQRAGAARDRAEPDPRKHVGVVALARSERAAPVRDGIERAAAGEDGAAVAPRRTPARPCTRPSMSDSTARRSRAVC